MKLFRNISVLFAVTITFTVSAKEANEEAVLDIVKHQVQHTNWHTLSDNNEWGYTLETLLDNGNGKLQHRVQRFNPNLKAEKQWQLIEQDQNAPTKGMLHEYAQTHKSIRDEEPIVDTTNVEIVQLITLQLKENKGEFAVFSFKPNLPMFDEDINKVFDGHLFFNTQTRQIEKLVISIAKPFSPGLTINVEQFEMNIAVVKIGEQLHVSQIESHKSGTAFLFNSFDETSTRKLTEFVVKS